MALINIQTSQEEQQQVLTVLSKLQGQTVSVTAISKAANMNPNRVRYVITDLEDAKKIERVPTKAFNAHYVRYSYKVL